MANKWNKVFVVAGVICGFIVLITAPFLGQGLLVLGYAFKSNPRPKIFYPFSGITVWDDPNARIIWKVDDRFSITFDNGFVIVANSNIHSLPEEWHINEKIHPNGCHIVIRDIQDWSVFGADIDRNQQIINVSIETSGTKARITDLRTGKTLDLNESYSAGVVSFFESLPK